MRIILFCLSFFLFFGCAKENNNDPQPDPVPSTNDIALITTSAVPGELVFAQANFRPAKDTTTILIGGKQVLAIAIEDNRIVFFMPELTAGTAAIIQYKNLGVNKNLTVTVANYTAIIQPDLIFTTAMQEQDEIIQHLKEYKDDPVIQLDPAYLETIQYIKQGISAKFAALSPDEKKQVAYVFRSNRKDPSTFKMEPINPLFYARNQTEANQPDAEDVTWQRSGLVLALGATGLIEMATGIGAVAAAIAVAPAPIFGILVGVSAAIAGAWLFLDGVETVSKAVGEARAMIRAVSKVEPGIEGESTLEFTKDINKTVTFKGNFRTILQSDATASNALLKKATSALLNIKEAVAKMKEGYEKVKLFILGTPPVMPVDDLQFSTQPFSKKIAMQGAKLEINNVSNPAIIVTYTKEDAALVIKARSTTITQETPFSFNVVYTNPTTGSTVTQSINCNLKGSEPEAVSIISGNNQAGVANSTLPNALVVVVKDINGNPLPGVTVSWTVNAGGGQLTTTAGATGSNGQASNSWKLGASGTQSVTATVKKNDGSNVTGSPLTFSANMSLDILSGFSYYNLANIGIICPYYKSCSYDMNFSFQGNTAPTAGSILWKIVWDNDGDGIFEGNASGGFNSNSITAQNSNGNIVTLPRIEFCWGSNLTALKFMAKYKAVNGDEGALIEGAVPKY